MNSEKTKENYKDRKLETEKKNETSITNSELILLGFIVLALLSFLSYFLYDSSVLIGNCRNNVPVEHCNNPAGDFAVEPDTRSVNIESGCGADEESPCIFTNIGSVSDAIKMCNSLGNKCNRFMYNNNTMSVVSLVGDTIESQGNHMFLRQNGITFQGQGNPSNAYKNVFVPGENTPIVATTDNVTVSSGTGSYGFGAAMTSLFSNTGSVSSGGGGGSYSSGGGGGSGY